MEVPCWGGFGLSTINSDYKDRAHQKRLQPRPRKPENLQKFQKIDDFFVIFGYFVKIKRQNSVILDYGAIINDFSNISLFYTDSAQKRFLNNQNF
jgi:hypothetical protein